jgi:hypothetical protein
MASILRVDTLTDASSNNSTAMSTINQGTAKAWVNFNGQGTIAARDSFNLASLTDNGDGDYTITFSNNMGNANYIINGTGEQLSSNDSIVVNKDYATAYTTSAARIAVTQGSTRTNPVYTNFSNHGDLA